MVTLVYLFLQVHVAVPVHMVLGVVAARAFAGAQLNVDIDLEDKWDTIVS